MSDGAANINRDIRENVDGAFILHYAEAGVQQIRSAEKGGFFPCVSAARPRQIVREAVSFETDNQPYEIKGLRISEVDLIMNA
jgi:hypothetical protein